MEMSLSQHSIIGLSDMPLFFFIPYDDEYDKSTEFIRFVNNYGVFSLIQIGVARNLLQINVI